MSDITAEQFFEEILPTLFKPKKAKRWNRTIQYHVTDVGDWYVVIQDQTMTVHKGTIDNPQMVVEATWDVLRRVYTGELFAPTAISSGELKVQGPMSDHIKWSKVISKIK